MMNQRARDIMAHINRELFRVHLQEQRFVDTIRLDANGRRALAAEAPGEYTCGACIWVAFGEEREREIIVPFHDEADFYGGRAVLDVTIPEELCR